MWRHPWDVSPEGNLFNLFSLWSMCCTALQTFFWLESQTSAHRVMRHNMFLSTKLVSLYMNPSAAKLVLPSWGEIKNNFSSNVTFRQNLREFSKFLTNFRFASGILSHLFFLLKGQEEAGLYPWQQRWEQADVDAKFKEEIASCLVQFPPHKWRKCSPAPCVCTNVN